ncbi:MAG: reverse transcriptase domain-containing protein, partial [Clostridium sp.]
KILKSEIKGIGIPTKGTPQGGIISPLLANVVLNELDWWVSSQWETFETNYKYKGLHRYKFQRTSNLKEMWLVRYADDFKIFCRDYNSAKKVYKSVTLWLKDRLELEVSADKSKIT